MQKAKGQIVKNFDSWTKEFRLSSKLMNNEEGFFKGEYVLFRWMSKLTDCMRLVAQIQREKRGQLGVYHNEARRERHWRSE